MWPMKPIFKTILTAFLLALAAAAQAASSSGGSCAESQKAWDETWACKQSCIEKSKCGEAWNNMKCAEGWANLTAGGNACSTWIGPAAAVSVVLLALAGSYYLIKSANNTETAPDI